MKTRILFVDDEENVLDGIRRTLRDMREKWDTSFASSAHAALEIMAAGEVDVVVTDMRMPGMDGMQLLSQVMTLYPRTIRLILSGHTDREVWVRAAGVAHQFMVKPCKADDVKHAIVRALQLRTVLHNEALAKVATKVTALPYMPELYMKMLEELRNPAASVEKIGAIVEQDIGLSAKILQVVNSAYFGLPQRVSSPAQAAVLLGIESLKALVFAAHFFVKHSRNESCVFSADRLWSHSMTVSATAFQIAKSEGGAAVDLETAYSAGLLHDVGKLVLAMSMHEQYDVVIREMQGRGIPLHQAEKEILGTTHGEVGGYLLGLWGLPDSIVETIVFHHNPSEAPPAGHIPLIAVHGAHMIEAHGMRNASLDGIFAPDELFLQKMQLGDRFERWRGLCSGNQDGVKNSGGQG